MSLLGNSFYRAARYGGCSHERGCLRKISQSVSEFRLGWCTSNWPRRSRAGNRKLWHAPVKMPGLDASQKAAAEAEAGPHLIEAGPGTGKTQTLIARIEWLLERGVEPTSILVLTFSNKAAEELRERVAASAPDAAPAIWAGTFHAFGLDILRKFAIVSGWIPLYVLQILATPCSCSRKGSRHCR